MPQITLEYSNNIIERDMKPLLRKTHLILARELPTHISGCKSRAIRHEDYVVADGHHDHAFVAMSVAVLKGRTHELLEKTGQLIMKEMQAHFAGSLAKLNTQLTLEIRQLGDVYIKVNK